MDEQYRKCRKCGAVYPIGEFYKGGRSHPGGRVTLCKKCYSKKQVEWRRENPEKVEKYHRDNLRRREEKYVPTTDKFRKCSKCGVVKPINEFAKGGTGYKSSGGVMTQCKKCWSIYYEEWKRKNPEKVKKYSRKTKAKLKKNHFFERRARQWNERKDRNKGAKVTAIELAHLWKIQRGHCSLSGRKLGRDAHLDHIIPYSKGGTSDIDNLRWLDPDVNFGRGNLTDEKFIEICRDIVNCVGNHGSLIEVTLR